MNVRWAKVTLPQSAAVALFAAALHFVRSISLDTYAFWVLGTFVVSLVEHRRMGTATPGEGTPRPSAGSDRQPSSAWSTTNSSSGLITMPRKHAHTTVNVIRADNVTATLSATAGARGQR